VTFRLAVASLLFASCSLATPPNVAPTATAVTPFVSAAPTFACGPFSPECIRTPGPPTPPPTPRPTRSFESAEFLITREGDDVYLIDPYGFALYTRDADPPGKSECDDECAIQWPPVTLLPGETPSVKPARFGTVGEIVRGDGSRQLTFNDKPLYYNIGDTEGGEANGMCEDGWSMITPLLVEPLCPLNGG
jgi:predicted lipoprotein with Yx(FWY)xxD motif